MKPSIEVELRGLLTQEQYDSLTKRLENEGVRVESDDKDTFFFNVPRGIFKVCDEISKGQGKLSIKIGSEETGALKETEIVIKREQIPSFMEFFEALGYTENHHVPQIRKNFFLKDSILSLKFTPDFQYHFEIEGRLLKDEALVDAEKDDLKKICDQYGLVPLEPEEIAMRVKEIRKRIGFDK
jgi:adenylate cyclase class IV